MKTKKTKYRFNSDKLFRNFVVVTTIATTVNLIVTIAEKGISWMSTIGYFG